MKKNNFINFIPVILPVLSIILFGITNIIESYSRETVLYLIIGFLSTIFLLLGWLPNIVLSILIVIKNKRNNSGNLLGLTLGVVGIIISIVWFSFSVLMFVGGQSV